jgi:hypothetical protein
MMQHQRWKSVPPGANGLFFFAGSLLQAVAAGRARFQVFGQISYVRVDHDGFSSAR